MNYLPATAERSAPSPAPQRAVAQGPVTVVKEVHYDRFRLSTLLKACADIFGPGFLRRFFFFLGAGASFSSSSSSGSAFFFLRRRFFGAAAAAGAAAALPFFTFFHEAEARLRDSLKLVLPAA